MADTGIRYQIRKDLRDYDNPKAGRNPNFQNLKYLKELEVKWNMSEKELREIANAARHKR